MSRKAVAAAEFSLANLRTPRRYVWREIEREDDAPLRVKLLRLTMAEAQELTFPAKTPMAEVHAAIAPYVVDWSFRAEDLTTGELVNVPPPAEIGGEVFEIMEDDVDVTVLLWLKTPQRMLKASDAKKASSSSRDGDEPSSSSDSD